MFYLSLRCRISGIRLSRKSMPLSVTPDRVALHHFTAISGIVLRWWSSRRWERNSMADRRVLGTHARREEHEKRRKGRSPVQAVFFGNRPVSHCSRRIHLTRLVLSTRDDEGGFVVLQPTPTRFSSRIEQITLLLRRYVVNID